MKRHSEAVARRESIPRKVKKVETISKKRERKKSTPRWFSSWNHLPNEIKALIVQKMDVKTSLLFKECGWNELELARNHSRNSVDINLKFSDSFMNSSPRPGTITKPPIMRFVVKNAISKERLLEWLISESPTGKTKIEFSIKSKRFEPRVVIMGSKTVATATSMILRRLLTEPMFVVNELKLNLEHYDQKIDLDLIKAEVGLLILNCCYNSEPVFSMLQNKDLNFKKSVGVCYADCRTLYERDILLYGRPRTVPARSRFPRVCSGHFCSFLFKHSLRSHQVAYKQLKEFWDLTLGFYSFVNINAVNEKLKLKKTTDDIMTLRAAYYYDDDCVQYIQRYEEYSDRIAFLEDGIDEHLSDYQITILSIAYLVRLFRYEPEMEKIYDIAFEDLRLVLKKYENVNLYEKIVAKLEALLS